MVDFRVLPAKVKLQLLLSVHHFSLHNMDNLPDHIFLRILNFLPKVDLCSAANVSRRWKRVSYDRSLWHHLNLKHCHQNMSEQDFLMLIRTRLASVRQIHFGGLKISVKTFKELCRKCHHLEMLTFGRDSELICKGKTRVIYLPETLKAMDVRLSSGKFDFLKRFDARFEKLEYFGLGAETFSLDYFPELFFGMPNLKMLDFTNCEDLTDAALKDVVRVLPLLESLCLIGCRKVEGDFLEDLTENCKQIRTLLLRYLPIEDRVLQSRRWREIDLEELDISACPNITGNGLSVFLPQLKSIRYLNMSYCGIGHAVTDDVLYEMMMSGVCLQLEMLDIRWSFLLSSCCLSNFLPCCKNLMFIGIYQSSGVFSSVISGSVSHLPRMQIIEFGGLRREVLTATPLLTDIKLHCKELDTLSVINFTTLNKFCDEKYFTDFITGNPTLKRINLCDCAPELVRAARVAAASSSVTISERWECALPPPIYTLDTITRKVPY